MANKEQQAFSDKFEEDLTWVLTVQMIFKVQHSMLQCIRSGGNDKSMQLLQKFDVMSEQIVTIEEEKKNGGILSKLKELFIANKPLLEECLIFLSQTDIPRHIEAVKYKPFEIANFLVCAQNCLGVQNKALIQKITDLQQEFTTDSKISTIKILFCSYKVAKMLQVLINNNYHAEEATSRKTKLDLCQKIFIITSQFLKENTNDQEEIVKEAIKDKFAFANSVAECFQFLLSLEAHRESDALFQAIQEFVFSGCLQQCESSETILQFKTEIHKYISNFSKSINNQKVLQTVCAALIQKSASREHNDHLTDDEKKILEKLSELLDFELEQRSGSACKRAKTTKDEQ